MPFRFDRGVQFQPEVNNVETDTTDLPPPENYLSLSMLDDEPVEEVPEQRRLSTALIGNRLIKTEPVLNETIFDEENPTVIVTIFGNRYYMPLSDQHDFQDYSVEFHKTHPEGTEMDLDEFEEWAKKRREKQEEMMRPVEPAVLRAMPGPYRPRAENKQKTTPKRSHTHGTPPSGNVAQKLITEHYRKTKSSKATSNSHKGGGRLKWVSLR